VIISIEGPDFVGKNSLIEQVLKQANNIFPHKNFKLIQFPNNETEIGVMLRKKLLEKNWKEEDGIIFQLLNTAHRYEYLSEIKYAKEQKDFILFIIRYNLSGPVYASVDGLNATKVWELYSWFDNYLPDMTFIITREFKISELEKERDPDHYENEIKQEKVRKIYNLAETLWADRLGKVFKLTNNGEMEATVKRIFEILQTELK
jgi:thymidylate kinase